MMTPLGMLPSPCSPNISHATSSHIPFLQLLLGVVGNGVGGNLDDMEQVCNGVRKFLIHV